MNVNGGQGEDYMDEQEGEKYTNAQNVGAAGRTLKMPCHLRGQREAILFLKTSLTSPLPRRLQSGIVNCLVPSYTFGKLET